MSATAVFKEAIGKLGGPLAAAVRLGRAQSTISGYLKDGNAPADVCMRIEIETGGAFLAEDMRPDLAVTFRAFRDQKPNRAGTYAPKRRKAA